MTIVMPWFLLFVLGILLLLCVEMWALLNSTSRRLALGVVSLLSLNPHNKRHSFGLFISLYLCCVVDCINIYIYMSRSLYT